jgi:tol-pal system beta propeller repeat protein TolB
MNLYVTTPDGVEQIRLTAANSEDNTPRISPDGTRVAFVSTVDGNMDIYVVDVASRAVTRITDAPQKDSAPAWSADGSKLAFESFRDGNFEIYVANADGSNQLRLTNDPSGDHSPLWSPVTNDIAFTSDRFGNSHILLLDLNGGVSSLTTGSAPDFAHSWSPDGNWIAYKTSAGGEFSNICVIGRYGMDQRCLTTPSEYGAPVWSPDGRFLAANAKQTGGYGIDVINVADGSVTHLFSPEVDPRGAAPSWSPEGLRLAFQAQALDGSMELFTVLTLTNEFTRLTTTAAYDGEPIWSAK